jgi:hypothetical protein
LPPPATQDRDRPRACARSRPAGRYEAGEILRPRADEFRQGIAIIVALAEEHAVRAQAGPDEAGVLDEDAVQAVQLIERKGIPAGLKDGAAPAFEAVARRALAFDLEGGPAVGEQQEACGAGDQLSAGAADGFGGEAGEPAPDVPFERRGAADDRAVIAGPEQVVADAVSF